MWNFRRCLWGFLGLIAFGVWTFAAWSYGLEYGRRLSKGLPPLRMTPSVPVAKSTTEATIPKANDAETKSGDAEPKAEDAIARTDDGKPKANDAQSKTDEAESKTDEP